MLIFKNRAYFCSGILTRFTSDPAINWPPLKLLFAKVTNDGRFIGESLANRVRIPLQMNLGFVMIRLDFAKYLKKGFINSPVLEFFLS